MFLPSPSTEFQLESFSAFLLLLLFSCHKLSLSSLSKIPNIKSAKKASSKEREMRSVTVIMQHNHHRGHQEGCQKIAKGNTSPHMAHRQAVCKGGEGFGCLGRQWQAWSPPPTKTYPERKSQPATYPAVCLLGEAEEQSRVRGEREREREQKVPTPLPQTSQERESEHCLMPACPAACHAMSLPMQCSACLPPFLQQ